MILLHEIRALERDIRMFRALLAEFVSDRLNEAEAEKPLTPDQARRRAERDQDRNARIADNQASATRRVSAIRTKMGR